MIKSQNTFLRLLLLFGLLLSSVMGHGQSQPEAASELAPLQRKTHARAPRLREPAAPPAGAAFADRWVDSLRVIAKPELSFGQKYHRLRALVDEKNNGYVVLLILGGTFLLAAATLMYLAFRFGRLAQDPQNVNAGYSAVGLFLLSLMVGTGGLVLFLIGLAFYFQSKKVGDFFNGSRRRK